MSPALKEVKISARQIPWKDNGNTVRAELGETNLNAGKFKLERAAIIF